MISIILSIIVAALLFSIISALIEFANWAASIILAGMLFYFGYKIVDYFMD